MSFMEMELIESLVEDFFKDSIEANIDFAIKNLSTKILEVLKDVNDDELSEVEAFVNSMCDLEIYLENDFFDNLQKDISEIKILANILSNAGLASNMLVTSTHAQNDYQREQYLYNAQRFYEMLINYLQYSSYGEDEYFKLLKEMDETLGYGELEIIRFSKKEQFASRIISEYPEYDLPLKIKAAHILCSYHSDEVKQFFINVFLKDNLDIAQKLLTYNRMVLEGNKELIDVAEIFKNEIIKDPQVDNTEAITLGLDLLRNGTSYLFDMINNSDDLDKQLLALHYLTELEVTPELVDFSIKYLFFLHDKHTEWNEDISTNAALSIKVVVSAPMSMILPYINDDKYLDKFIDILITIDSTAVLNHLSIILRYNVDKVIEALHKRLSESNSYRDRKDITETDGMNIFLNSINYTIKESLDKFFIIPQEY